MEAIHEKILSRLKKKNKVIEFSSNFGPNKLLNDMFMFLWKSEDVQCCINFDTTSASKDYKKAEIFRKEGNTYYSKKDLSRALEYYNKSIIYSPHPNQKDLNKSETERTISRNLAICYANRSAVLYELENYDACLKDINQSFSNKYPSILKYKLIERQAKCYIGLDKMDKAREILKNYIEEVSSLDEKESKLIEESVKKIKLFLLTCDSQHFPPPASKNVKIPKDLCNLDIPELKDNNLNIPSLSSSISLLYSMEKGRYLVANRDIYPGELLVKEKSFGAVVLPSAAYSHCSYCLRRTFTPVPCQNCSSVVFCTDDCLANADLQFHEMECSLLPTLIALDIGKNANLALRLVIQMTLGGLKNMIPVCDKEKTEKNKINIGFNDHNIYDSSDFRTIYHLVTNLENRTVGDLFKRGIMAVCLVKLLMKSKYFDTCITTDEHLEDISLVGKTIFTLLMSLPCNAHSITEMGINAINYQESHMEEIGAGAFGVLSLTNHSCNPTMARSSYGSTIIAKSVQFIPKGAEVTDSYGYHFAIHNIEERQYELKKQYYFSCCCEACVNKWLQYPLLDGKIYLKCPKCFSKMESPIDECSKCKTDISRLFYKQSSKQIYYDVKQAIDKVEALYKTNCGGQLFDEHEKDFVNTIYLVCLYTSFPSKALFEAQETLKYCFDSKGSHYYV